MAADVEPSFGPELFGFLRDLAAHNDREWFGAAKPRYVREVQEPALAFVEDVGHRMPEVSPHFSADARTVGGSLFRIYRDTRFSKDKTPYKTHTGIQFRHVRFRDAHAPGYYLHLEPGNVFAGCGLWRPESATLKRIRDAIAARPDRWAAAVEDPAFAARFTLGGDSLKRPPAGYDRDHPRIEDLKRKDFIAFATLDEATVVAPGFLDEWVALCAAARPLMAYLCAAVGVEY